MNAELDRRIAAAQSQIEAIKRDCEERLHEAKLASLPEAIRA